MYEAYWRGSLLIARGETPDAATATALAFARSMGKAMEPGDFDVRKALPLGAPDPWGARPQFERGMDVSKFDDGSAD